MTTALVDADLLVYRACAACETEVSFDDSGEHVLITRVDDAQRVIKSGVDRIIKDIAPSVRLVWGDTRNWRRDVSPSYKSNRASMRRPMALEKMRQWARETYPSIGPMPLLEGDDILGIAATTPGNDVIVVSDDKDLRQIPGTLAGFDGAARTIITLADADHWHMMQTLTGDTTDGYPGCPGVGPVKAASILKDAEDPWAAVVKAYERAKLTEADALIQARLARILRHGEYNPKTHKVNLWTPPAQ